MKIYILAIILCASSLQAAERYDRRDPAYERGVCHFLIHGCNSLCIVACDNQSGRQSTPRDKLLATQCAHCCIGGTCLCCVAGCGWGAPGIGTVGAAYIILAAGTEAAACRRVQNLVQKMK